jgi:heptosyltransferase III
VKILVIQLTRLGDILSTIPALSAIKRENHEAEIHILTRKRFAGALECTRVCDEVWTLDTAKILGPMITEGASVGAAATELTRFVTQLRAEKYDKIINLSFSPSSSFITHLIAGEKIPVAGYTRTSDFYLRVPDVPSQYFYAQVGLDRSNRIHVADLFAWISGVGLSESDFTTGVDPVPEDQRSGVVCHLGASQDQKVWPEASWVSVINGLIHELKVPVTLVGAAAERELASRIAVQVTTRDCVFDPATGLTNAVGRTTIPELVRIVRTAKLFIGADSGPLHVASLTRTKALNLSVGHVRFWETGPLTRGSRVLVSRAPEALGSDTVLEIAGEMLRGANSATGFAECAEQKLVRYKTHRSSGARIDFWPVVEWIYFNGPKPVFRGELARAVGQLREVCEVALQQLEAFYADPQKTETVLVLDRLDELIEVMRANVPPVAPLIDWFKGQKENIPPASREEVFYQTKACYISLANRCGELLNFDSAHTAHTGTVHNAANERTSP